MFDYNAEDHEHYIKADARKVYDDKLVKNATVKGYKLAKSIIDDAKFYFVLSIRKYKENE